MKNALFLINQSINTWDFHIHKESQETLLSHISSWSLNSVYNLNSCRAIVKHTLCKQLCSGKLVKLDRLSLNTSSIVQNSLTVIQFFVRVPVLSVQIVSAPPIDSEEASLRTQFFSLFIFITENAKEIVTARGRPSGIAITITVTAVIIAYRKSVKVDPSQCLFPTVLTQIVLPQPRTNAKRKKQKPIFASQFAIASSFYCRGV